MSSFRSTVSFSRIILKFNIKFEFIKQYLILTKLYCKLHSKQQKNKEHTTNEPNHYHFSSCQYCACKNLNIILKFNIIFYLNTQYLSLSGTVVCKPCNSNILTLDDIKSIKALFT